MCSIGRINTVTDDSIHFDRQRGMTLRAISRAIDRFCHRNRGFGIPKLMTYIVFISAIVFVIRMMDMMPAEHSFISLISFSPRLIMSGQIWRLVTWVFLPLNSSVLFTAISLYLYYFIGSTLEREWGTAKFTIYYIFGVALNIIYGFLFWLITGQSVGLIPNYLNLSMFFAFAALFPDLRLLLFFVIPVKIKWLALANAAFFIYNIVIGIRAGHYSIALLPLVALLNFFLVCGDDVMEHIRPHKSRISPSTINFKRQAKKARKQYDGKPYHHKCAVCGKNDAEYPDLEFRYCSRCNGFHCFCIEHINNHVHFQ